MGLLMPRVNIGDLIDLFSTEIGKKFQSKETLRAYRGDLRTFFNKDLLKGLETVPLDQRLGGLTKYEPTSRARKAATLKAFFRWAFEEGYTAKDFSEFLGKYKVHRKLPHFISVDEAFEIWKVLNITPENHNERLLFLFLYGSGLRVSEAASARTDKVNFSNSTIEILGKGGKYRQCPLLPGTLPMLKAVKKNRYVFENRDGESLNVRTLHRMVQKMGIKAGINRPLHPHMLRHSYATHLLEGGASLRIIQELLGHSSLSTTEQYTHVSTDKLAATLDAKHPLKKIRILD